MARVSDADAFNLLDFVETDFSGRLTRHIITARFKVLNSQTGIVYEVLPRVPKSGEAGRVARLDHGWFKRIGRIEFDNQKVLFFDEREGA